MKAIEVAKAFVFLFQQQLLNDEAQEEGDTITNLKVQKLLYYAQAYSLLYYNKPLFNEKIEAWPHGPVVKEVFNEIKKEIGENGCRNLGDIWHLTKENFNLNDDDMDILLNVWNKYGKYTASKLRNMTHDEKPYLNVYVESKNNEITQTSIKAYFDKKLKQEAQEKREFYGIDRHC
ncbi:Panacea domain-containing protein [Helicobacter fennelliae]|uniref:Prophage protein n=1 Tax=Helicobacter fennelliae TaxID=215 RepID=A0A2X3BFK4_9HELI|nr:type II toxin-antitoxin system antitoxin SocA domain-containing protein [Helicobacter fennelliae]SQB99591.1 prophage protein [Helicobacter fennelliae]STQ85132.1 prophage protein [Helicobacter fennelliae]